MSSQGADIRELGERVAKIEVLLQNWASTPTQVTK